MLAADIITSFFTVIGEAVFCLAIILAVVAFEARSVEHAAVARRQRHRA